MISPDAKVRKGILILVIVASVILYLAGVFSGLMANNLVKKETAQNINVLKKETADDINNLKIETKEDLEGLSNYIEFLNINLKNMQLEETFLETLDDEERCNFSRISLNELVDQLGYYWDKLPFRIEEYEKYNKPTEEYKILKEQYTHLSIRIWILARNQFESCNTDLVHGLYFYSTDCDECVAQGEQLDKLTEQIKTDGKDLIMFPIDFDSKDSTIRNIKEFYSINSTPALIINDKVFQGRLFAAEELIPIT
jgi:hypothetical protein